MPRNYTLGQAVVDFACGAVFAAFFFASIWVAWLAQYAMSDECPPTIDCE